MGAAQRKVAGRVIAILRQRDPALLANMAEIGVVRREWLEGEGEGPISVATPLEVVQRLLERSIEQQPSLLATLGLSAIQVLNSPGEEGHAGTSARMTVVFTDLEGFTRFTAKQGDEAASQLLATHHQAVGPVVRSRGGRTVKRLGDGLLLTFPEPEAAVLAALELVEGEPVPLRLRAGIHLGDVVMTRDDVIGHVVNVAARVTESAKGGEVLVTAAVRDAAAPHLAGVAFGPARSRRFKGIGEPVGVSRVRRRAGTTG